MGSTFGAIGQFLQGLHSGTQQNQLMNLQKSQNLMATAKAHMDAIPNAATAEERASHWQAVQQNINDAEAVAKGSTGPIKTIMGLIRPKKAQPPMEDPASNPVIRGLLNLPSSPVPSSSPSGVGEQIDQQTRPPSLSAIASNQQGSPISGSQWYSPMSTPSTPTPQGGEPQPQGGLPAPSSTTPQLSQINDESGVAGVANAASGIAQPQPQVEMNHDGVVRDMGLTPGSLGGGAWAPGTPYPQRVTGIEPTSLPLVKGPNTDQRSQEWGDKWGLPLDAGQVTKDESTGHGLEIVRIAPGETRYEYNGQVLPSFGAYETLQKQQMLDDMTVQNKGKMNSQELQDNLKAASARFDQEQTMRQNSISNINKYLTDHNMQPVSGPNTLRMLAGQPLLNPAMGQRWITTDKGDGHLVKEMMVMGDDGVEHPVPGGELPLPDNAETKIIKSFMVNPNKTPVISKVTGKPVTYDEAETAYYASQAQNRQIEQQTKAVALENAKTQLESHNLTVQLRQKAANGTLNKKDVQSAIADSAPFARQHAKKEATVVNGQVIPGTFDTDDYLNTLHQLVADQLQTSWDKLSSIYGGNPDEFSRTQVQQGITSYLNPGGNKTTKTQPGKSGTPVF